MSSKQLRGRFLAVALVFAGVGVRAENPAPVAVSAAGGASVPGLSSAEVVDRMQHHNQVRTEELKDYKSLRHYEVQYQGFATTLDAKMDVEVKYTPSTGKTFQIVSQSGSNFLCDKVLKKAVDSEKEASADESATALTSANYRFQLVGNETVNGRPAYILSVEPITSNKFLYRGKIWVDTADFAVVKIEAEPAKNPSFWIARTLIHFTTDAANGFWLPGKNRSETKVRIGGTAVFTIDYGNYEFDPNVAYGGGGN
jgi:outer membrane lipoprotein-sorting protein